MHIHVWSFFFAYACVGIPPDLRFPLPVHPARGEREERGLARDGEEPERSLACLLCIYVDDVRSISRSVHLHET